MAPQLALIFGVNIGIASMCLNLTQEARPADQTGSEADLGPTVLGSNVSRSSLRAEFNGRDVSPSYPLVATKPTSLSNTVLINDHCDGFGQKDQDKNRHWDQCC